MQLRDKLTWTGPATDKHVGLRSIPHSHYVQQLIQRPKEIFKFIEVSVPAACGSCKSNATLQRPRPYPDGSITRVHGRNEEDVAERGDGFTARSLGGHNRLTGERVPATAERR